MQIKKNELIAISVMLGMCLLLIGILFLLDSKPADRQTMESSQVEKDSGVTRIEGGSGEGNGGEESGSGGEDDSLNELKGKLVQVEGLVRSSHVGDDGITVVYVELSPMVMARCAFAPDKAEAMVGVQPDSRISLICTYAGKDRYLRLSQCGISSGAGI